MEGAAGGFWKREASGCTDVYGIYGFEIGIRCLLLMANVWR